MTKEPDEVAPGGEKPGFLWKELRGLIEVLQDLHLQISSRLLEKRIEPPAHSTDSVKEPLDVSQALKNYIDTHRGEQTRADSVDMNPTEESSDTRDEAVPTDSAAAAGPAPDAPLNPNELSDYLKEHAVDQEFGRHLGEKMRATTLEHLNRTVQLARQGDRKGAYIHAELAENAMRLARQYMSPQEFEIFQKTVQERLDAVKSETLQF